jgi:hypothetical protein
MTITTIVIGVLVGAGVALLLALPLSRRGRKPGAVGSPAGRRSLLGTPAQRLRALWMAVVIAAGALVAAAAGGDGWAGPLLLLALMLAGQSALFSLIELLRARRR